MAIKAIHRRRVAHWRFIYSPTAPPDSDNTRGEAQNDLAQQAGVSRLGSGQAPSVNGCSGVIVERRERDGFANKGEFEAGLALAEVTLGSGFERPRSELGGCAEVCHQRDPDPIPVYPDSGLR